MSEPIRTPHGELSIDDLVQTLPGTGDLMAAVGESWWKCAHAARGGNWDLSAYFARRVRSIQRRLAILRPKYREDLASFERERIDPVLAACGARDGAAFERAFGGATDEANRMHDKWGYGYIRWTLPETAPADLDMRRQP